MAKKIVNPTSTLQINFDNDNRKPKTPAEIAYRVRLIFGSFLFLVGGLLLLAFVSSFLLE